MHRIEQAFDQLHETVLAIVGGTQRLEENGADRAPEQFGVFGIQRLGTDPLITAFADVAVSGRG